MQDVLFNEKEKLSKAEQAKESEKPSARAEHLCDHNTTQPRLGGQRTLSSQHPGKIFHVAQLSPNSFS